MKKKVIISTLASAGLILLLGGCSLPGHSSTDGSNQVTSESGVKMEKGVKRDAEQVLSFMFSGKTSSFSDVSSKDEDTVNDNLITELAKKQEEFFTKNGSLSDYALEVDGSIYTAQEIIDDYASAYMHQTHKLSDFEVTSAEVTGDEAIIKASFTPIASLSEANPIGAARTEVFGSADDEEIIRESQNKDVKQINRLITLKLYSVYYGEMDSQPELAPEKKEIEFKLTKSGDHYVADDETFLYLAKESRDDVYSETDPNSDMNNDNSETKESSETDSTDEVDQENLSAMVEVIQSEMDTVKDQLSSQYSDVSVEEESDSTLRFNFTFAEETLAGVDFDGFKPIMVDMFRDRYDSLSDLVPNIKIHFVFLQPDGTTAGEFTLTADDFAADVNSDESI